MGVDSAQGVWQAPPFEVLANAPGGLESSVKIASVCGAGSRLESGMFEATDEQPANAQPNTTPAAARVMPDFRSKAATAFVLNLRIQSRLSEGDGSGKLPLQP